MLETIAAYIERHHLLPPSGEIIVAVSGGADSLCLLHLLHRLCGPGKRYPELRLHAAHLNHKLRGEASAQDAAVVAQIATAWGLPLTVGELDVPALARQERRSLEDAARTARYRFLREVARGQPIAVAHHADDQVETLLLHWLRGAGLAGMVGILPRQQDIIRPLLEVSHAQTVAYCQQHQIVPLQDASNTDPRFLRNRIRHELLPLLESLNQGIPRDKSGAICLGGRFGTGIRATLLRNAEVMRVDAEWIEAQVDASWPTVILEEQIVGTGVGQGGEGELASVLPPDERWDNEDPQDQSQNVLVPLAGTRESGQPLRGPSLHTVLQDQLKRRRIHLPPANNEEQRKRIMEVLARVQSYFGSTIEDVIQTERTRLPAGATIVVITSTISDLLLDSLTRVRQSGHAVTILYVGDTPLPTRLAGATVYHIGGQDTWKEMIASYTQAPTESSPPLRSPSGFQL